MFDTILALLIVATALSGILAGTSLDQSIKQLPARHRIGAVAYSLYSRASDLGNGIVWYSSLGVGAALLTIAAAIAAFFQKINFMDALPIYLAALFSILHSLVTTQAAPFMFSQRGHENDEGALAEVFNRFERWQTLRAILQVLTFGALLWAMVSYVG
jgi:hypothetical protein